MRTLKTNLIVGFIFVSILGTLWHFVYEWSGDFRLLGFIAPINESTFEHMKLIFFPSLIYMPVTHYYLKDKYPSIVNALSYGILYGTFFLPIFFYSYSGIIGQNFTPVDIGSFYIGTLLVFLVTYRLLKQKSKKTFHAIGFYLLFVMIFIFVRFTYNNPGVGIFAEP